MQHLHPRELLVERVFACDLVGAWEVVYFLKLLQALIDLALKRGAAPLKAPVLLLGTDFYEAIIL